MLPEAFFISMNRLMEQTPGPVCLVCGLSGGMDSMALLHLLARWRDGTSTVPRMVAAHLNHGLRGEEADRDEDFCRSHAARLGFQFHSRKIDVAGLARNERLGVEEAGRRARYRFFAEAAAPLSPAAVTGHHADDQAETILLNLKRGAHRRGLCGMREHSLLKIPPDFAVPVIRPLLLVPRDRIALYARAHSLSWREDATNSDVRFARNRVRHRIIPALEAIMPGFRDRLLERSRVWSLVEDRMTLTAAALVRTNARSENGGRFLVLDQAAFADRERLFYAVRHVLEDEMGSRLPYGAVLSRVMLLAESGKKGESMALPGRLMVTREEDGLFFFYAERAGPPRFADETVLPDPPFDIRLNGLAVTARWAPSAGKPPGDDMVDPEVEWFDPAAVKWPLILRRPYPGEKIRLLGSPGRRKIQDILVDGKVPRRKRSEVLVLADHAGGIWLWPFRLAHRVRLEGETLKALRISIREI